MGIMCDADGNGTGDCHGVSGGIVLVTGRWDAGQTLHPTVKLLAILKQLSGGITWVATREGGIDYADDRVRVVEIPDRLVEESLLMNLGYHFLHQLRVSSSLLQTGNSPVVFAFGSDLSLIPILLVRAFGRKAIVRTDGRPSQVVQRDRKRYSPLKVTLFRSVEQFTYRLASRVVPESPERSRSTALLGTPAGHVPGPSSSTSIPSRR